MEKYVAVVGLISTSCCSLLRRLENRRSCPTIYETICYKTLSTKMTLLQTSCYSVIPLLPPKFIDFSLATIASAKLKRHRRVTYFAAKSGGFSLINSKLKKCERCGGQGAIECPGCKGTGKNKKNGNIFERWKCFDCQGFGLKSCPVCGKGGLTPEQRGER